MEPSLEWMRDLNAIVNLASSESERLGLAAMDALHVAAAILLGADQIVTTEKPGKPIYRADTLRVTHVAEVSLS